jgi:hypothetical protein
MKLLSAGMIITFCFLVLYNSVQPYCTPGLSKTQACTLISQFISLFSASCLVVTSYVQKDLISAGEADATNQTTEIFGGLIIGANLLVAIWPVINVLMSAEFIAKMDLGLKAIRASINFNQEVVDNKQETARGDNCQQNVKHETQTQTGCNDDTEISTSWADLGFDSIVERSEEAVFVMPVPQPVTNEKSMDCVNRPAGAVASDFVYYAFPYPVQMSAAAPFSSSIQQTLKEDAIQ